MNPNSNFYDFVQLMYFEQHKRKLLNASHHKPICDALTRVILGETKRLIINVPPRSGKTLFVSQMFPAFCMGLNPASSFILTSYSKTLASNNTYMIRELMRHEVYQSIFSDTQPVIKDDSQARDEFRTEVGGMVYGVGAGGTITGKGAGAMGDLFSGAILIDDISKPSDALSETMRANTIEWFRGTLESRKNSPDTPIIIIMQRLHEQDLSGWLLDGGNGEEWELLKIPALREDGSSFWPKQFPVSMLERLEKSNPYTFAGQYQQLPAPKEGGDFKPGNIQIIDALPAGLRFVRGWDLAATTKKTSDYTATIKLAEKDGIVYIAHGNRFKGSPDEVEAAIVQMAELDGRNTEASLPQDPGQAGVAQKQNISRKLKGHRFEFSPETGDKRSRAGPFAAQVNVGNVRMLKGEWNEEFIHELQLFPNGKNDDLVDASSRAYNRAVLSRRRRAGVAM